LESSVATLLLVTSAVVLCCVVVNYAVTITQQTLNLDNIPQLDRLRDLENSVLNQTNQIDNGTFMQLPGMSTP
jgi:hypothetical protein